MEKIVIVGGGIAGLLVAKGLGSLGFEIVGLDRADQLGSDLIGEHVRVYRPETASQLSSAAPGLEWKAIEESVNEWKKGKWDEPDVAEFSETQKAYLHSPVFLPFKSYRFLSDSLTKSVGSAFTTKKTISKIDAQAKLVVCADATEVGYSRLIWCSGLESLFKACESLRPKGGPKSGKSRRSTAAEEGGLVLEMEFSAPLYENLNTVVLPFRFKDNIMKALGVRSHLEEGTYCYSWIILLEDSLYENREEVAKCVRSFKRELVKQFTAARESLIREKIVCLPVIPGPALLEAKSLGISDEIFYAGSQLRLPEDPSNLMGLDLLVENSKRLIQLFSTEATSALGQLDQTGLAAQ